MYNVDYNYDQKTFFVSKKTWTLSTAASPPLDISTATKRRRTTSSKSGILTLIWKETSEMEFWFWFEKIPSELEVAPPHKLRTLLALLALLTVFTLISLLWSNAHLKRFSCHFEANFEILLLCHFIWNFLSPFIFFIQFCWSVESGVVRVVSVLGQKPQSKFLIRV